MFTNDYIMRQIELLAKSIRYVAGMDSEEELRHAVYTEASDTSKLKAILYRLLGENKFCEAEDELFRFVEKYPEEENLLLAINFYSQLNKKSDDELLLNNFPRDEIMDGLREIERIIKGNSK